jgi:uncharacterized protein
MNLNRLHSITKDECFPALIKQTFEFFNVYLKKIPHAVPEMLTALHQYLNPGKVIILVYDSKSELDPFLDLIHSKYFPNKSVIFWNKSDEKVNEFWSNKLDFMKDAHLKDDKVTVYLCENFTCQLPTNDLQEFKKNY